MERPTWRRNTALILLVILVGNFAIAFWQSAVRPYFFRSAAEADNSIQPGNRGVPSQRGPWNLARVFPQVTARMPTDLQHAGDERLFVVEQPGRILSFSRLHPDSKASVFLDITERVKSGGEQGLLAIAFHPAFKSNSFVFVHYSGLPSGDTVISRFRLREGSKDELDPRSEEVILRQYQPYSNHNGGSILFGPDGYLYISLGDGGSGGDPQGNGQNLRTLLGKILRIDVDKPSASLPYSIPADNPFVSRENGAKPEIFAYGLRNAWKISFDSFDKSLWAADVGQDDWEEIDIIKSGRNYGWNAMEGKHCFSPKQGCEKGEFESPILDYPRSDGQSVTGGYVYRGKRHPELFGKYIYADFVAGKVWALDRSGGKNDTLVPGGQLISSLGVDPEGELYFLSYRDGGIYQLVK